MEIKTWLFFSFWATVSIVFLKFGFNAFDTTNLSRALSPFVLFFFNHAAAISVCYSSHYTFVYSPQLDIPEVREMYHLFLVFALTGPLIYNAIDGPVMWYLFPIWGFMVFFLYFIKMFFYGVPWDGIGFGIDFSVKMLIYFGDNKKLVPILVLLVFCYTSSVWAAISDAEGTQRTPPLRLDVPVNILTSTIKKMDNLVQFGAGILRGIVFQDENSSRKAADRICSWDGGHHSFPECLQNNDVQSRVSFPVFRRGVARESCSASRCFGSRGVQFLAGECGCWVYGERIRVSGYYMIAYGASVLLYGLRVELQTLSMVNRGEAEARVLVW